MKLWIRLALRNVTRNFRRTMLTTLTVVVGTALVTLALSWITGIFGTMTRDYVAAAGHIRLVDADFAARESLQPLYENIADVSKVIDAIKQVPGVVAVEPRILTGVVLAKGEEIGDDFAPVVGGTDSYYRQQLKAPEKLLAGGWLTGAEKEVVLGRKVASQLEAKVGDKILLLGQTQNGSMSPVTVTVMGVIGGDGMIDQQIYLSLEEARWLTDMPDAALEVLVWTAGMDALSVGPVADALHGLKALEGLKIQPWYERQPWAGALAMMDGVKGFIQALIVFVAALAIFNTMTMSVLERTTEIGVMRAMGLTRLGAVGLFVLEGLTIGLIGGLGGTLLGALPSLYLERHGVSLGEDLVDKVGNFPMRAQIFADLTPETVIQSILLGLVIAVVGAFLPALRAASVRPVTAMRARR